MLLDLKNNIRIGYSVFGIFSKSCIIKVCRFSCLTKFIIKIVVALKSKVERERGEVNGSLMRNGC